MIARIVGNTIRNNTGDGVGVFRRSQADVSSNTIEGNAVETAGSLTSRGGRARDLRHNEAVIASRCRRARWLALLALLWLAVGAPGPARAQAAPPRLELVMGGLASPNYLTHARDGSGRLFVVEQGGRIKVLAPSAATPSVFLDISGRVLAGGEQGLLGLAFHPQYAANGRLFVNYTRQPDGATVIAEYRVSPADPSVALQAETVLLTVTQPFANHNGGMIEFGPDGFLYIALGDGGSGNDPDDRAQDLDDLLGKILRIDVDRGIGGLPYAIPPDNPFAGAVPGRDEIWASGLRNPFRFAFDRLTGALIAADVGQNEREEVDVIVRGGNYGWRVFEGTRCTGNGPAPCDPAAFTPPIVEYDHSLGRCAITGGYVYRGAQQALPAGTYVFADFCTGEILTPAGGAVAVLLDTDLGVSSFGEDEAGEIYVVALGGTVHRLAPPAPPGLTLSPPAGDYVVSQIFDLVLIASGSVAVTGGSATLDGADASAALRACLVPGTLAAGGTTFRCPDLGGVRLGAGTHVVTVTLAFADGSSVTRSVTWRILPNTEP
jgi:glucose/arabinose dehydrogenase